MKYFQLFSFTNQAHYSRHFAKVQAVNLLLAEYMLDFGDPQTFLSTSVHAILEEINPHRTSAKPTVPRDQQQKN